VIEIEVWEPHLCVSCKGAVLEFLQGTLSLIAPFRKLSHEHVKRRPLLIATPTIRGRSSELRSLEVKPFGARLCDYIVGGC
jgi:hypothetical protein